MHLHADVNKFVWLELELECVLLFVYTHTHTKMFVECVQFSAFCVYGLSYFVHVYTLYACMTVYTLIHYKLLSPAGELSGSIGSKGVSVESQTSTDTGERNHVPHRWMWCYITEGSEVILLFHSRIVQLIVLIDKYNLLVT